MLSHAQLQQFKIDGYLVLANTLDAPTIQQLRAQTEQHLSQRIKPFELEADVHYPGAPDNYAAQGGATIRRLLMAYDRDALYRSLAMQPHVTQAIAQILSAQELYLSLCHHNCIMTKQPQYSSATLWHRDTRYWNFNNKYLINAWFALRDEQKINGAMKILPGSHRWEVQDSALDAAQFLLSDHPDNRQRLATQRVISLNAGDVVLFSAHCFHAAGRNTTPQSKYSVVFTYHSEQTHALAGTHSASLDPVSIALD